MKVLICSDYSIAGEHVLREAQKFLAALPDVEIHVCSVIDISVVSTAGMFNNTEMINTLEKEANEVNKWAKKIFAGKEIHFSTEVGHPFEVILQKTINTPADLLILGTHGKTGLGRILIGSVAENILRHTTCNTLIIPVKHLKNG